MFEIIKTDTVIEEDWNLEDTNDLMKLCEQYELFWPVIIDRIKTLTSIPQQRFDVFNRVVFSFNQFKLCSGLRSKSVEELQSRYYFIKSKTGDSKSKYHGEDFVSKERNRRRHQDWLFRRWELKWKYSRYIVTQLKQTCVLFNRTKEEELQETKLKDEIKLIESQLKKMKKQVGVVNYVIVVRMYTVNTNAYFLWNLVETNKCGNSIATRRSDLIMLFL